MHSTRNAEKTRGYSREQFAKAWRQLGIALSIEPAEPVRSGEPVAVPPSIEPVEPVQTGPVGYDPAEVF